MKPTIILTILFLTTITVYSQWSTDPYENLEITYHGGNIHELPDGNGGAIISYNNFAYDDVQTFYQRVNRYGYLKWDESLIIADGPGIESYPEVIFLNDDGTNTLIFISGYVYWVDSLGAYIGYFNNYVQKIDSSGNKLWGENGIRVNADSSEESITTIGLCNDNEGGIFVAWDFRKVFEFDTDSIFIQHISSDGKRLWGENGILISDSLSPSTDHWLISDDSGGIFINYAERLERFNSEGEQLWGYEDRDYPEVRKDGQGGLIVSDIIQTYPNDKIMINRIAPTGEKLWGEEGIIVDDSVDNNHRYTALLFLNSDSTVSVFWDNQWYPNDDLFFQRYTLEGEQMWGEHLMVSNYTSPKGRVGIVESDSNSNVIVWGEFDVDSSGIFAQKIDKNSNKIWDEAVRLMQHSPADEGKVITDGNNGAIVIWSEDPPWGGIYAQQISKNGNLGEVLTSYNEGENSITQPESFNLYQNYPNPFNPTTTIKYKIPDAQNSSPLERGQRGVLTKLIVYDILGKQITMNRTPYCRQREKQLY